MINLLIFILPIFLFGIVVLIPLIKKPRFEIIIPAGMILGLTLFTFVLNLTSFVTKGQNAVDVSYLICLIICFIQFRKLKIDFHNILNIFKTKFFLYWFTSILTWGGFFYWKVSHALIGSDTNLYHAIAHTFIKGNFPALTPWQPDLPLSYHLGTFELLGAFHHFSQLNFQFLHLFFSFIFIFCASQIILWIWNRHQDLISFLLANLVVALTFISFGFIYITWPTLPFHLPTFSNVNELIIWLRQLPTVNQAIEVYGAPINMDALIYFIFHSFGLAIFLSLTVILLNKNNLLLGWVIVAIGLATLALVNESIFVAVFPALVIGIILKEGQRGTLLKNLKFLAILLVLTIFIVFTQGGVISNSLFETSGLAKSTIIFPKKEDIKDDFTGYHKGQVISKLLPENGGLPLRWFHPGIELLLIICGIFILGFKFGIEQKILLIVLFIAGFSSLLAYYYVVPKFLVANGNRFLAFAFLMFSLQIGLSVSYIFNRLSKAVIFLIIIFVILPTILPPLTLLSKTRFGENKLQPKEQISSPGIKWMRDNLSYSERVVVLDSRTPHPSGQARAMIEAGVFAPVFSGEVRAFTIEASPEYMDIAYYLSPQALKELKVKVLLIDNFFYDTLPEKRKEQLKSNEYFNELYFDYSSNQISWEKIYKINDKYLNEGGEMEGTFDQIILPKEGRFYIDLEENFNPSYLRRPLIFLLRGRDLYFEPGSGVYLNVEVDIPFQHPPRSGGYDYLVLSKKTDPREICGCYPKLIWQGLKDEIFIWQVGI